MANPNPPPSSPENPSAIPVQDLGGKYLTFMLAGAEYGVNVLKIREILGLLEITPVPRIPEFVRGVINLRGKVLPVIDLRIKFHLPPADDTHQSCIVVVGLLHPGTATLVGILVDTVSEVVNIMDSEIDKARSLGGKLSTSFILGLARKKDGVRILLDIEKILTFEQLQMPSQF